MGCTSSKEDVPQRPVQVAAAAPRRYPAAPLPPQFAPTARDGGAIINRTAVASPANRSPPPEQDTPFTARVYSHTIPSGPRDLPCWSIVSEGRPDPGIMCTILRRPHETEDTGPPVWPMKWMQLVCDLADRGIHLENGQMLDLALNQHDCYAQLNNLRIPLDRAIWADVSRFGGILHGHVLSGIHNGMPKIPSDYRQVILLTHEEAAVARQFGVTRVLGHVGFAVRWFPHPPFIDRDRPSAVTMADQAGSFRSNLPIARIYGVRGMFFNDEEIILTIPGGDERREKFHRFVQSTSEIDAVAFECFISTDADSGFIWKAGQSMMMAYGRPGGNSRRSLGYIAFAPSGSNTATDTWSMVEDGYGLILNSNTWRAIRNAMLNTQDIVVGLEQGTTRMKFRLEWEKTHYHNPIDGTDVHAPFTITRPTGPPSKNVPSWPHMKMSLIVCLPIPSDRDCDPHQLVKYVHQVLDVVAATIPVSPISIPGSSDVGRQVIVEVQFPKSQGWLKVVAIPSQEGLPLQQMFPGIAQIQQPPTLSPFKMQLFIDLWGYQGQGAQMS